MSISFSLSLRSHKNQSFVSRLRRQKRVKNLIDSSPSLSPSLYFTYRHTHTRTTHSPVLPPEVNKCICILHGHRLLSHRYLGESKINLLWKNAAVFGVCILKRIVQQFVCLLSTVYVLTILWESMSKCFRVRYFLNKNDWKKINQTIQDTCIYPHFIVFHLSPP